jgi:hypothetical protein
VWAEAKWVGLEDVWLGVRSTVARTIPDDLPAGDAPADAPRQEGVFTLVPAPAERPARGPRPLNVLYMGPTPIHSDRALDTVQRYLVKIVEIALGSRARPTYHVRACEFGGRRGLYARDLHNRSAYRRRLQRAGMSFSESPVVHLEPDGSFLTDDWGPFHSDFVISGGAEEDGGLIRIAGALLPFTLASYRFGPVEADELATLISACRGSEGMGADDPLAVIGSLEGGA